ncbi:hypothetical protein N7476_002854 [Penicillium atrosanguineum]|uniref:Uncharacterized protein n=1 Tax=Penicillium atrosanguineum TaxID=1132637 RepID=A0A9W9Q4K4_9EURO|nr:hypothetical protein N7476_002854 [Penicillium atrosanguineum]
MFKSKKQKQDRRRGRQTDDNGSPRSPGQGSVGPIDERPGKSQMASRPKVCAGGSAHGQPNSSADAAKHERLMRLQMDDLGTARRERLSTEDDPRNIHRVQHEVLEASRESNIPGTEAFRRASQNRTALAGWANAGKIVATKETSYEQLADIGGGQSHRAALNARLAEARSFHNESTRNASAKHARGNSRARTQAAHVHRHVTPVTTRASPIPVAGHFRLRSPPDNATTSGREHIAKSHDSSSKSSSQGGGSLEARGHGHDHAPQGPGVEAVRSRADTTSRRKIGNWASNISSPQVFLDNLRQHGHLAVPPPGTRTPPKPVQSTSRPIRSASRSPRVVWTPLRSASRHSQSVTLPAQSSPVLIQPDLHQSVPQPTPQPISHSIPQTSQPIAQNRATGDPTLDSATSNASALEISCQSTTPPPRRMLVPTSRQPRKTDLSKSMSDLPLQGNLLLDFEDTGEAKMHMQGQKRQITSDYPELMGLDFKEPPLLDWSTSVTPARPNQTPAEIGAAIWAEALDFNRARGNSALEKSILGESHSRDNGPPATPAFGSSIFVASHCDEKLIPVGDNPFFFPTPLVPTTENASLQSNLFSIIACIGQEHKNAVRDIHSSTTCQSLYQPLFNSYRSPGDTPLSGASKKSKARDIPSPSLLSPDKGKHAYFTSGFERLRVSESPTRVNAAIPKLPAVPTPVDGPRIVGTLRHSRWAEPRLKHHEIENSKSKVIGVCASLESQYLHRHHSVWEHPEKWEPRTKVPRTTSEPAATQPAQTQGQQQVPASTALNNLGSPRALSRALGPALGPVKMISQQLGDLNQASRRENRNSSAGSVTFVANSSWFTPTDTHCQSSPRPKAMGLEPYNLSTKTATQSQRQAPNTTDFNDLSLPRAPPRVLGPAPVPMSVWSQRQDDLRRAVLLENQNTSTGKIASTTSSTQSIALSAKSQSSLRPKPKAKGLEPYNPSSKKHGD